MLEKNPALAQHWLSIPLGSFHLAQDHAVVNPALLHKLLVAAAFDDAALFHQQD